MEWRNYTEGAYGVAGWRCEGCSLPLCGPRWIGVGCAEDLCAACWCRVVPMRAGGADLPAGPAPEQAPEPAEEPDEPIQMSPFQMSADAAIGMFDSWVGGDGSGGRWRSACFCWCSTGPTLL